jgi:hypothetical protein
MKQKGFLDACEATLMTSMSAVVNIYHSTWNTVTWLLFVPLASCEKVLMELLAVKHLRA